MFSVTYPVFDNKYMYYRAPSLLQLLEREFPQEITRIMPLENLYKTARSYENQFYQGVVEIPKSLNDMCDKMSSRWQNPAF